MYVVCRYGSPVSLSIHGQQYVCTLLEFCTSKRLNFVQKAFTASRR